MSSQDLPDYAVKRAGLILLADSANADSDLLAAMAGERGIRCFPPASRTALDRLLAASRALRAASEVQRERAARARSASETLLKRKRQLHWGVRKEA